MTLAPLFCLEQKQFIGKYVCESENLKTWRFGTCVFLAFWELCNSTNTSSCEEETTETTAKTTRRVFVISRCSDMHISSSSYSQIFTFSYVHNSHFYMFYWKTQVLKNRVGQLKNNFVERVCLRTQHQRRVLAFRPRTFEKLNLRVDSKN